MPSSATQPHANTPTLASRQLPRRVRELLEGILEFCSAELDQGLVATLNEFEQQLFKFAEQARSNMVQTRWLEAQRLVKRTRHDLVPRFLVALEAELAGIRDPVQTRAQMVAKPRLSLEMSLVGETEMDEASVLIEVSSRTELRNSLPLYLLGQRFGVIAGKPAMDAEALPIGPQALCRMVRSAADCLDLSEEHRLIFFRTFDRQVMPMYGHLVESINTYLAKKGVLPWLQYVPVRARPTAQGSEKDMSPSSKAERGGTLPAAPSSLGLSLEPVWRERSARADLRASASGEMQDAARSELGVAPQFVRENREPAAPAPPPACCRSCRCRCCAWPAGR